MARRSRSSSASLNIYLPSLQSSRVVMAGFTGVGWGECLQQLMRRRRKKQCSTSNVIKKIARAEFHFARDQPVALALTTLLQAAAACLTCQEITSSRSLPKKCEGSQIEKVETLLEEFQQDVQRRFLAISSTGTPLVEGPNHPTDHRSSTDEVLGKSVATPPR